MGDWIKEHPYLAGASAIGLLLVFIMVRKAASGSSAPSGTVVQGSTSDGQLAAGAAVQQMQIASQRDIAGYSAQVNIAELLSAADVEKTRIGAQVSTQGILSGAEVLNNQTSAQLQYGLATLGHVPGAPTPAPGNSTVVSFAPNTGTAVSTFSPTGDIVGSVPAPKQGQTFADYWGGTPGPSNYFDTGAVQQRESLWEKVQNMWISDPNSPHNLPPGDYYDANGHLQSRG